MIPKFRAHSVEENTVYYPDENKNVEWTTGDGTGLIVPLISLENGMWGMINKYVLMQSTGLKDKNDVESWEGDYPIKEGCRPFFIKRIENEGCLMAVPVNSAQRTNWKPVSIKELPDRGYTNNSNVHENPELLEVKQMAIKGGNKSDFEVFNGGFNNWMGFNKQKYTREQAIEGWRLELALDENTSYIVEDAFVRYRFRADEDNENRSCWWLEWRDCGHRSVPVWSIRTPFSWELEGNYKI